MDARKYLDSHAARVTRGLVTIDIDLTTAKVNQVINSPGTLFYLDKQSTGICYVQGSTDQGFNDSPLLASPGFAMLDESGFSGFRFSSPAQPGKMLRVVIASGMTIKPGDPVQSGSVATPTVDAALARTIDGQAFLGTANVPAVAAQYSHAQLWNPVTSTKDLILEAFSISTPVATSCAALLANAQLAGAGITGSKKAQAVLPVPNGLFRVENNVAVLGINYLLSYNLAAGAVQTVNLREPIVLRPGFGLNLVCATANVLLNANFEWFEQ